MAATGVDGQIARALLERVRTITLSPAIGVSYPDVATTDDGVWQKPFDDDGNPEPYLEVKIFRAPTEAISVAAAARNDLSGILQITLVHPKNVGAVVPAQIASAIISHFVRGTKMTDGTTTVEINRAPYVMSDFEDPPYVRTPVTIRWQAFAAHT